MKNKFLFFCLVGIFAIGSTSFFVNDDGLVSQKKYSPRTTYSQGFNEELQYLRLIRNNQITGKINPTDIFNAQKYVNALSQSNQKGSLDLQWEEIGPNNVGGRTRAILIDKNNPNTLYAGSVSGGLWKSTTAGSSWIKINDMADNLIVASIAQDKDGNIYVGTGEGLIYPHADNNGGSGFIGKGIFKSTNGTNFTLLTSTIPTIINNNDVEWACVNKLACDPVSGRIYAATNNGLRMSDDGGIMWTNPVKYPSTSSYTENATDVDVASDRTVVASVGNKCFISPLGNDATFINHSNTGDTNLPVLPLATTSHARIELAIAPSNPKYMYCSAADENGDLKNIYQSIDKGKTWKIIGPGGSALFVPFGSTHQGWYDNTIVVHPNNPELILLGGIDMWLWENGKTWTQKTINSLIHSNHHVYVFHPTNSAIFYVGSDGGISKTINGGVTFQTINTNYNVTQFYSVACDRDGKVMGGTHGNGTQYIDMTLSGNQKMNGKKLYGSDGGWSAFSNINPDVFFATTHYGTTGRSANKGVDFSSFISARMTNVSIGKSDGAAFITPTLSWETTNDIYSNDYVTYCGTSDFDIGQTITANSKNNAYPFNYVLPVKLLRGDTIIVKDIVQSKFFLGARDAVWMTREALNFAKAPAWFKIATLSGTTQTMAISLDGNYLFAGTSNGNLYRISNIRLAYDSLSTDITSPFSVIETTKLDFASDERVITSIAVDPTDANHIVVTLGNYGNTVYIYESKNALDQTPTFTSKQGTLPAMPIYASLIELNNPNTVIIGTEYGVYATDNISATTPTWTDENIKGMAHVPVFMIRQQTSNINVSNYGMIYIGTHGRGIFKCAKYVGIDDNFKNLSTTKPDMKVYPNPVIDNASISFNLYKSAHVYLKVYDISGKLVKSMDLAQMNAGYHQESLNCSDMSKGVYVIKLVADKYSTTTKFFKLK